MNNDRVLGTMMGLGIALVVSLAVLLMVKPRGGGIIPGPEPTGRGEKVVVLVDNSAPSIPQAIVLDGGQMRALKDAGRCALVDIREEEFQKKGYAPLLAEAGGAPALLVFDHDGDKVFAGRLPTDAKALTELLQKAVLNLPPPLPAWPAPVAVNRGGELPMFQDANGVYADVRGQKRYLTARPDPAGLKALPRYADHNPVFPVAEWYEVNRHNLFASPDWIIDQDGIGECVGCGWAGALRRARVSYGMADVPLSPGYLYSLINRGQDKGAAVSDGIDALKKLGTCSYSTVGIKPFYTRQMPPAAREEAKRFRLVDAYRCDTWEEVCSALLTGRFYPVFGVQVGKPSGAPGNFGHFDKDGVAGHDAGPSNHCMHADGLKKLADGRWCLDVVNSWGYEWGPFRNGRVLLDKAHLFSGGNQPNVCVVRLPSRDPSDAFAPPAYKGK